MTIDKYVSLLDPTGVDVCDSTDAYLAGASATRGSGPYHFPQITDAPTIAPRDRMYLILDGTDADIDYIVLTYTAANDGYSGAWYYYAEYVPDDELDARSARRYLLRIDTYTMIKKIRGGTCYVRGDLIRGHALQDYTGSDYLEKPADIYGGVSVKPFNPSGSIGNIKMQVCAEFTTAKGNFFIIIQNSFSNLSDIENVVNCLWLIDKINFPNVSGWADLSMQSVSRVWVLPFEISNAIKTSAKVATEQVELKCTDTVGRAFFAALLNGIVPTGTYQLAGHLCAGSCAFFADVNFNLPTKKFRAFGNSIKMVPIPAGSPSYGTVMIDFTGPASFTLFGSNPASAELSIVFDYRGEKTQFADTLEVTTGSADHAERRQKAISDALGLMSGGVSLAASAASGNVIAGVMGAANLAGSVTSMMDRKYSRQMTNGGNVFDILFVAKAGDSATSPKIYGLGIITADSSNSEAVSAEADLYGPSGRKRASTWHVGKYSYNVNYIQIAAGSGHLIKSSANEIPVRWEADLIARLERGLRVWNQTPAGSWQGYRSI